MKAYKRIVALFMTMICLIGCFSGCGSKDTDTAALEVTPAYSTSAMGRYVEKQIPVPEGKYALDMVMLSSGQPRIALSQEDGSAIICTMVTGSQAWEVQELPGDICESGNVAALALSPDGTIFCHTAQGGEEQKIFHLWVIAPQGEVREIPNSYTEMDPEKGYLITKCDFTDSGKLIAQFQVDRIHQIDLNTGELGENLNTLEKLITGMYCAGEDVYFAGWNTASAHINGETVALDSVMGQQIVATLKNNEGSLPKFTFWKNGEGYLFYTTQEGLFSYIPGGSIIEELVGGTRSTLGDPSFQPTALAGADDDTFYVLGSRGSGENLLLHYTYDAEVPTVSDT